MFLEFPNKNNNIKRYNSLFLVFSFVIMFIVMYLMQEIKHPIIPNITIRESHWITNIFSALAAVIIARYALRYLGKYHAKINDEIEKREELEKERTEVISILDTALDSTVDGILIVNKAGKVEKSNKKFLELWKIPPSILETNDDAILIDYVINQLKNPEVFLEKVHALYANPLEESFDELYFKDGRVFERYSKPQHAGNDVIGRVWSFRDVTEKKRTEKRIKLFEHMVASVQEIVNISDLNDIIIYVNRAFCKAYGYTESEIIGKHSSIFWSKNTPRDMLEKIRPATLGEGWHGEIENMRKDGTVFPIYLSTSVIRDNNNNPLAMVGVARDISERKKEELIQNILYKISQAVQSTESLRELFSKIHEIIKEKLPLNNFYLALKDDQTGVTSYPYFTDEDKQQKEPQNPARGCTEYVIRKGEAELINRDRFVDLSAAGEMNLRGIPAAIWLGIPLKVFNNIIGVMAVQDYNDPTAYGEPEKEFLTIVSEQIAVAIYKKRTEYQVMAYTLELQTVNELLSESEKSLKELNASKDKFFSIISHDLKGPYQGLLSILDLLIKEYDNLDDEEKKDIFIKIRNNSQRTYNLLDNLLQWSRLETGKVKFSPEKLNIYKVTSGIIDLFCDTAIVKKIKINNLISNDINIFADQNMIQLIMRNLLSNAIKFSYPDNEILVSAIQSDGYVEVTVKDFGVGMDLEKARNLFRIDIQNSTIGTAKETGTGLGLLLCKEMVNLHKGTIWSLSEEGKGSTFTFSIPNV
jgi:PAS domain S-box-containing protein